MSMLVDMTLPRPIPAKAALRMVRTSIKTLMYMRGVIDTPWEQLEQMLQIELHLQEQEQEHEQDGDSQDQGTHAAGSHGITKHSNRNDTTIPTKSLQGFLETGERMFIDLEESIYIQLYSYLKSSSFATPSSISTSSITSVELPLNPKSTRLSTSSTPRLYISLAVVFGTTVTTPKEQYMIRIGPLEPQQPLWTRIPTPSPSAPLLSLQSDIAGAGSSGVRTAMSSLSGHVRGDNANGVHAAVDMDMDVDTSHVSSHQHAAKDPKLAHEEKIWERKLVQQIVGINNITHIVDPSTQYHQHQQHQEDNSLSTVILPGRTKVHLLIKAPSGLAFQGLLPKQMVAFQEDYSLYEITSARQERERERSGAALGEVAAPHASMTGGTIGNNNAKKKKRWPIHHLHVLGPLSAESTATMEPCMTSLEGSGHCSGTDMEEDDKTDEIWYQVGSGIPILSSLL
ncbi:hypothetical protein BGZ54_000650 [Gamsiella multidivaricata]|nr:hypothetical protein BGZ54_000650 [Gamsiella multidivaricata]